MSTHIERVAIFGAGKIGALISCLLAENKDYRVWLVDVTPDNSHTAQVLQSFRDIRPVTLDVNDKSALEQFITANKPQVILSSLPFFCNVVVAEMAGQYGIHYFDLTEDTSVTQTIKHLSGQARNAFVPQCGLAPGYVGIVANHLIKKFDSLDTVKLRAGALPQRTSNALQYALTWSTDGLINEYGNPCYGIDQGKAATFEALKGLEQVQIDGLSYEAFHTSGGLGSLAEIYENKVQAMDYKTLRYPGHCEKMRVLMQDFRLNDNRDLLKKILERAVPKTYDDVVIVYVSVTGKQQGHYIEESHVTKIYPQVIAEQRWSAIQVATACGLCGVFDYLALNDQLNPGFLYQEQVPLDDFLANRFGQAFVS